MKAKKVLSIISIVLFYCFISYNVFVGLMYATAVQGFSGLMLILLGLIAVVLITNNINEF